MRFRFKLACGHSTAVVDDEGADGIRVRRTVFCDKCHGQSTVVREKLSDAAKLPAR